MMDDERLDRAIDEAARELTGAAPSRGFARRVRERIEQPRRATAWVWQAAGGLAVVTLVAYFAWPEKRTPSPVAIEQAAAARTGTHLPPAGAPPEVARVAPSVHRAGAPPHRTRAVPRVPIDPDAPQIAALGEIEELTVMVDAPESLALTDLQIPELAVAPLAPGADQKEPR